MLSKHNIFTDFDGNIYLKGALLDANQCRDKTCLVWAANIKGVYRQHG